MLAAAVTDATFEKTTLDGKTVWVGKCIHCNRKLTIADDGTPLSRATIEHIWPRNHGGANDLRNIALACSACNRSKSRHDRQHRLDVKLADRGGAAPAAGGAVARAGGGRPRGAGGEGAGRGGE